MTKSSQNNLWISQLPSARVLSQPRCQSQTPLWYLVYRWLLFITWVLIIICSMLELGSFDPKGYREMWFIYLTNWDLCFGASQALLGLLLVMKRWRLQKNVNFNADEMSLEQTEIAFWFLNVVTSTLALVVSITYWVAVHDPEIHVTDPLNIAVHGVNSVLMILDLFVSGVPFQVRAFWWCPAVMSSYVVFSLSYYIAGGLDKLGNHYVYKILDWQKPNETLLNCFIVFVFVVAVHCLLCYLALFRDFMYRSYEERIKSKNVKIRI